MTAPHPGAGSATPATVEAVVRQQMSRSLGGRRGVLEGALPGLAFTVLYLVRHDLRLALVAGIVVAAIEMVLRLVQRSSLQHVLNAVLGIVIGWAAVRLVAGFGGTQQDQALAFFLPGILITGVYTVLMILSCLVRWPMLGFLVGTATGDPLEWHENPQVVRLCSRLTWLFLAPGGLLVAFEGPVWLLGHTGVIHQNVAVLLLGIARLGVGWPLRLAFWAWMVWLLARNHTPLDPSSEGSGAGLGTAVGAGVEEPFEG